MELHDYEFSSPFNADFIIRFMERWNLMNLNYHSGYNNMSKMPIFKKEGDGFH